MARVWYDGAVLGSKCDGCAETTRRQIRQVRRAFFCDAFRLTCHCQCSRQTQPYTVKLCPSFEAVCSLLFADPDTGDASFGEGLQRVKEHLLSGQRGAAVCLICLESVRRSDAVWACQRSCSSTFHLLCIQVGQGFATGPTQEHVL